MAVNRISKYASVGSLVMEDLHVRWMQRRDWDRVLRIEEACFRYPMTEKQLWEFCRKRNHIQKVAVLFGQVAGFMLYGLHQRCFRLCDLAVHPCYQRKGVGQALIGYLEKKLSPRRSRIVEKVRESNLGAQLFFKACGFRAVKVERAVFLDTGEDAYVMERRYDPT